MQGRGSGTQFELLAGQYIASQLQQFGVEPAGETDASGKKTYIQTVNITKNAFAEVPTLSYSSNGSTVALEHGKQMLIARLNAVQISGGLQKITFDEKPKSGAISAELRHRIRRIISIKVRITLPGIHSLGITLRLAIDNAACPRLAS